MTDFRFCAKKLRGSYAGRCCSRLGTVERDGKWYCWQHDPERIEKARAEKRAKAKGRAVLYNEGRDRKAAMIRICEGVSTEELQGLEAGAVRRLLEKRE